MKRYSIAIVLLALLAAALWGAVRWRHTLRNVYEDSWWITTPDHAWHTAWPVFDAGRDRLYQLEQLAEQRQWRTLLPLARAMMSDFARSDRDDYRVLAAIAMRYALLAESCLGSLPYNITMYPVRTPEDFVLFREMGRDACLFNMFFFRELGLPDEVFHQAMQYPLGFAPCTHRALRMMTESADPAVARKLSVIAGRECDTPPAAAPQPLRSRAFVFGDPMARLFAVMLDQQPANRRLVDYTVLSLLMMGEKGKARYVLDLCPVYQGIPLPPLYQ